MKIWKPTAGDFEKWDGHIFSSENFRPYALSQFLCNATDEWLMAANDDRSILMPLPLVQRFFIRMLYQPLTAQQLGPFWQPGTTERDIAAFLKQVVGQFQLSSIKCTSGLPKVEHANFTWGTHRNIEMPLNRPAVELVKGYNRNVLSNLRKAEKEGLSVKVSRAWHPELVDFFNSGRGKDLEVLDDAFYMQVQSIYKAFLAKGWAETWLGCKNGEVVGGAMLLTAGNRLVNFFTGNSGLGRKTGAMHAVFHAIIDHYAESRYILDFEGSDDDNLAFFYHSFGGMEQVYLQLDVNRLPWPMRLLKT